MLGASQTAQKPEPSKGDKIVSVASSKSTFGRQPENALWQGEAGELAAIVQYSNDAVFSRRLDGRIATWNTAAERIFGFKAKEVLGRTSEIIIPRAHRDEFDRLLSRIKHGEVVRHFETERLRKDGKTIFVSLTLSPVRDQSKRLIGFSTIARDITEQRQAQEALCRSERALADLFEEASVGLAWTTAQGRVLRANRALLSILDCAREECFGHLLSTFFRDRTALKLLLRRLRMRETIRNFPTSLRAINGQVKEVLLDASAFWENGNLAHLRWFVRDITRRKQLQRQVLAISDRERSAFARELHDSLGQQLSGIRYLANVLRDRLREAGSANAAEAERISNLLRMAIEQTRAVARGLSPVRAEPEGLSAALNELAMQCSQVYGIACQFRCPKPILVIDEEDATHLYRIAQEAVHNSFRHGQAKRVRIGLTRVGRRLKLKIIDDGKGIGILSPRRKGLGLHIMQYRAGLLQGTLTVRRRAKKGTEVCCSACVKTRFADHKEL